MYGNNQSKGDVILLDCRQVFVNITGMLAVQPTMERVCSYAMSCINHRPIVPKQCERPTTSAESKADTVKLYWAVSRWLYCEGK